MTHIKQRIFGVNALFWNFSWTKNATYLQLEIALKFGRLEKAYRDGIIVAEQVWSARARLACDPRIDDNKHTH